VVTIVFRIINLTGTNTPARDLTGTDIPDRDMTGN
jgi:hypothetical protein